MRFFMNLPQNYKTKSNIREWFSTLKKEDPVMYKMILEAALEQIQKELGK